MSHELLFIEFNVQNIIYANKSTSSWGYITPIIWLKLFLPNQNNFLEIKLSKEETKIIQEGANGIAITCD